MTQSKTSQSGPGPGDSEAVVRAVQDFQAGIDLERNFRVLVETYDAVVKAFFARRLGRADECLDLTQETFLRVYKGLKGYRGDAPFGAWLFRIAWNVLRRQAAGSSSATSVPLGPPSAEVTRTLADAGSQTASASAFAVALHKQRKALLWQAIARLPPQRRRCLTLWAKHDLTYDQIAAVMKLSVGTVKAHLAQARVQVQELVGVQGAIRSDDE